MMMLFKVRDRLRNTIHPPTTQCDPKVNLHLRFSIPQSRQTAQSPPQTMNPGDPTSQPDDNQPSPLTHDPYVNLPVMGIGLTGIVYKIGEGRVVKKAKQSQLRNAGDVEYMNKINKKTLENEIQVFKCLGNWEGIIPHFNISQYGIELAQDYPEQEDTLKVGWIISLIKASSYVHSCKVFVDDIALWIVLIIDEQLVLADFGQSILLPLDSDIASANANDLNVRIEILHLGWILYSIASWRVHKYYFFNENPELCWLTSLPNADDVLFGKIIKKCWLGEYTSIDPVKAEALQLLHDSRQALWILVVIGL
ncbi:uncharacterized protein BJX67DRAFT_389475 [Aspergillus lucknowensis]|uniref:Protein kinase domain-containing protein n=1 Tax=Aspergillus lucknowensis TaxID=176173 RepID=A0ABR4LL44_9EURO